jgi:hypothetical protein
MISPTGIRQANRAGLQKEERPSVVVPACPGKALSFTLIEVLITLVILSTSIVLVLRAFGTAAAALGESRDCLWTSLLAKEKITEIVMAAEDNRDSRLLPSKGETSEGGGVFYWIIQVRPLETLPAEKGKRDEPIVLNEIAMTLGRKGNTREYPLTTYITTGRRRCRESSK